VQEDQSIPNPQLTLDRGTVVLVELDPTVGREQQGVSPCVAVSDPASNASERLPLIAVVPVTGTAGVGALYPEGSTSTLSKTEIAHSSRSNAARSAATTSGSIDSAVATSHASFSPSRRAARRWSTAHRRAVREMQSLNREPLQGRQRGRVVSRTFQQFPDADDGADDRAPAQRWQKPACRAHIAGRCFAFEVDQIRAVEQCRSIHGFLCARPKPFPTDASTQSMRSSLVSIGPARSINARITSDFGIRRRFAQRARRAARFLSSLTVIVGMVRAYYAERPAGSPAG
jgi:hypothetical protein